MTKQKIKFEYDVPASHGIGSTLHIHKPSMKRKRTARERKFVSDWNGHKSGLKDKAGEKHANDWNDFSVSYQQLIELQSPPKNQMPVSTDQYNPFLSPLGIRTQSYKKKRGFKRCATYQTRKKSSFDYNHLCPTVVPNSLSKRQIKRRTGFKCETAMLKYMMVVCNGSFKIMTQTQSSLTWFEDWMIFFEMMWGKTHTRVEDFVTTYHIEKN